MEKNTKLGALLRFFVTFALLLKIFVSFVISTKASE